MNETQFIRSIKRHLPDDVYAWKVNDRMTAGIPDVWYSGPESDLWVEYKWITKVPKTVIPKLTEHQKQWLRDRTLEGRACRVIVGSTKNHAIFNTPSEWENGITEQDFLARAITTKHLAELIALFTKGLERGNVQCHPFLGYQPKIQDSRLHCTTKKPNTSKVFRSYAC